MSLLLIRHAETDLAGTFCGQSDPPVNTRGQEQIAALLHRLAGETIDAVYSSDLKRATQTATRIARPLTTTPALREVHFGDWEGLTWSEIEQRDAAYARRWIEAFPHLPAPNGETYAAFETRVINCLDGLLLAARHQRMAVVTHGGVIRIALRRHFGLNESEAWQHPVHYCASFEIPIRCEVA